MHPAWLAAVCVLWLALVAVAPSFGWCVVVLAFAALRILTFRNALVVVGVLIVGLIAATLRISDHFDPTVVAGPICLAVLAVATYRALDTEAERRQQLLDDLLRTQDDLAAAERTAGALSERQRLSREIHDSVTQDLASVSLLLEAATVQWAIDPGKAQSYVRQAAVSARQGLVEARGLVERIGPAGRPGRIRPAAGADQTRRDHRAAERRGHGRACRGHSATGVRRGRGRRGPHRARRAGQCRGTCVGQPGRAHPHLPAGRDQSRCPGRRQGLCPAARRAASGRAPVGDGRGFGLSGIRSRVAALGGTVVVESAPGDGTALAVLLPTAIDRSR